MCEFCRTIDGCKPIPTHLNLQPLNKEDWRDVYIFMRYVYLPFMHGIVMRARRRAGLKLKF